VNIFISYRRGDTQDLAGRIADRLRAVPGITEVFFDTTGIAPGADFVLRIEAALSRKPVCIVLLGPAWRGPRDTPRIFDARDVVRLEVARMLADGLRILPVLAGGATMPGIEDLPEDLQRLATLNALPVRHESFERDLAALVDAILLRPTLPGVAMIGERHKLAATLLRAVIAFLVSGACLVVAAALHSAMTGRSLEEALGGAGQVWLLILGVLSFGTLAGTGAGGFARPGRRAAATDGKNVTPAD
jgi:TIR domain